MAIGNILGYRLVQLGLTMMDKLIHNGYIYLMVEAEPSVCLCCRVLEYDFVFMGGEAMLRPWYRLLIIIIKTLIEALD